MYKKVEQQVESEVETKVETKVETTNAHQLYCLYVSNFMKKPIHISIKDENVNVYIPPKTQHHIIHILKPSGFVSASCPQSDGHWHDMPLIQSLPFDHGQLLVVGNPNEKSEKICGHSQRILRLYKQFNNKGICMHRMTDGSVCSRKFSEHENDSDIARLKKFISKFTGNHKKD